MTLRAPRAVAHDQADSRVADTIAAPQLWLADATGCVCSSDLSDLFVGQLCVEVVRSAPPLWSAGATLGVHVTDVVLLSADEQVTPSHAETVVAVMERSQAIRNRAVVDDDRRDVSADHATAIARFAAGTDVAVADAVLCPRPQPTWADFRPVFGDWTVLVHSGPEPIGQGVALPPSASKATLRRTESAFRCVRWLDAEGGATDRTDTLNRHRGTSTSGVLSLSSATNIAEALSRQFYHIGWTPSNADALAVAVAARDAI
jgi:hypothetical protein